MSFYVVMRGGGDLASGAVLRLARAGIHTLVTELAQPVAVRRLVCFAQAIYSDGFEIEGVRARRANDLEEALDFIAQGIVPVLVDPEGKISAELQPQVIIDGRMRKQPPEQPYPPETFTIGLGPGFTAGENCDAAIETMRGPFLGRVYWQGSPEDDTGQPEPVGEQAGERVLRAPQTGSLETLVEIGDIVEAGAPLAKVAGCLLSAPFKGVVRGLLPNGLQVTGGMKIGDIDPRCDPRLCTLVSDKALAVGGGVMEAILSVPRLREALWQRR